MLELGFRQGLIRDTRYYTTTTWLSSGWLLELSLFWGFYSLYNIGVKSLTLRRGSEVRLEKDPKYIFASEAQYRWDSRIHHVYDPLLMWSYGPWALVFSVAGVGNAWMLGGLSESA